MAKKQITTNSITLSMIEKISSLINSKWININGALYQPDVSLYMIADPLILSNILDNNLLSNIENNTDDEKEKYIHKYLQSLTDDAWININNTDTLYNSNGYNIDVFINDDTVKLTITKEMLLVKLRKADYNNISYKIFDNPWICVLQKKFINPIENHNVSFLSMYKII